MNTLRLYLNNIYFQLSYLLPTWYLYTVQPYDTIEGIIVKYDSYLTEYDIRNFHL